MYSEAIQRIVKSSVDISMSSFRITDEKLFRNSASQDLYQQAVELDRQEKSEELSQLVLFLRQLCYATCALPAQLPVTQDPIPYFELSTTNQAATDEQMQRCQKNNQVFPAFYSNTQSPALLCANVYAATLKAGYRGPLFICGPQQNEHLGIKNILIPAAASASLNSIHTNSWQRNQILAITAPGLRE